MGLAVETAPEGRRAAPPRNPPSRVLETPPNVCHAALRLGVRAGGLGGHRPFRRGFNRPLFPPSLPPPPARRQLRGPLLCFLSLSVLAQRVQDGFLAAPSSDIVGVDGKRLIVGSECPVEGGDRVLIVINREECKAKFYRIVRILACLRSDGVGRRASGGKRQSAQQMACRLVCWIRAKLAASMRLKSRKNSQMSSSAMVAAVMGRMTRVGSLRCKP